MSTALIILVISAAVLLLWYGAVPRRAAPAAGSGQGKVRREHAPADGWFTVATYNIHGGKGTDEVRDLARTAGVIRGAHVAALQEARSGWRGNQVQTLARTLDMEGLFLPTLRRWFRNHRGNGLLSAFPVDRWRTHLLPSAGERRYRIYSVAEITIGRSVVSVLSTHLHTRAGRERQLELVLERFNGLPTPAILLGDLNTGRDDPAFAGMPADARDCIAAALGEDDIPRVDWILARGLEVGSGGYTPQGVSDHPYFWVELRLP